jgi:hypothetical protein
MRSPAFHGVALATVRCATVELGGLAEYTREALRVLRRHWLEVCHDPLDRKQEFAYFLRCLMIERLSWSDPRVLGSLSRWR